VDSVFIFSVKLLRSIEHVALVYPCGLEFDISFVLWLEISTRMKIYHEKCVRLKQIMVMQAMEGISVSMAKMEIIHPKPSILYNFTRANLPNF